jgi:hypothetical protein
VLRTYINSAEDTLLVLRTHINSAEDTLLVLRSHINSAEGHIISIEVTYQYWGRPLM